MSSSATKLQGSTQNYESLERQLSSTALIMIRIGLIVPLLLIGTLKFTPDEAKGIEALVRHSPLMSWMYSLWSIQTVSNLIGTAEILCAVLLSLRFAWPRVALVGSAMAILTFVVTVSFMITTPGVWTLLHGIPEISGAGQFLIKDIALLGGSFAMAADALREIRSRRSRLIILS